MEESVTNRRNFRKRKVAALQTPINEKEDVIKEKKDKTEKGTKVTGNGKCSVSDDAINSQSACTARYSNVRKFSRFDFSKSSIDLAKHLLGKHLVHVDGDNQLIGRIVETEAYLGVVDEACHTYGGKQTDRTKPMYMIEGTSYVYSIYGMYCCLNISSSDNGGCVLLRALEPIVGTEIMLNHRSEKRKETSPKLKIHQLSNGPSKLCQAMNIDKTLNAVDMVESDTFYVEDTGGSISSDVVACKRIGIDGYGEHAASQPYRFYIQGNRNVLKMEKGSKVHFDIVNNMKCSNGSIVYLLDAQDTLEDESTICQQFPLVVEKYSHFKPFVLMMVEVCENGKSFTISSDTADLPKYVVGSNANVLCNVVSDLINNGTEMERHDENHVNMTEGVNTSNIDYVCRGGGKEFNQQDDLKKHMLIHDPVKEYEFKECGKKFNKYSNLKQHMAIHASTTDYECKVCSKRFNQNGNLKRHMTIHTGTKDYLCKECGKKFSQNVYLRRHMTIHAGAKDHECNECEKRLSDQISIKKHMEIHTSGRDYECNECGKMFKDQSRLNKHLKIHTGSKVYECKECGKKFNLRGNLKRHMTIHTGIKDYECKECGKKFSQNVYLKQHMTIHAGLKDHECHECGKTFNDRSSLKRHMNIHTGAKHYECNKCEKKYKDSSGLRKHMKIHTAV